MNASEDCLKIGELTLYLKLRRAEVRGVKIKLGSKQWEFLAALAQCTGTLVTREYLLMCLHPDPQERPSARSIDVIASTVRKKLKDALRGANYIHPISSEGYLLRAAA